MKRGLSTTALKIIALFSMLIDHIGVALIPYGTLYIVCRMIGRLAFPIFCFFISEGLIHTRNRGRYLLRMLIFALVSEIPFNLVIGSALGMPDTWGFFERVNSLVGGAVFLPGNQNVIWTFLLAATGITVFEKPQILAGFVRKSETNEETYAYRNADWVVKTFVLAVCAALGHVLNTDYGIFGICLVYVIYFTVNMKKPVRFALIGGTMLLYGVFQSISQTAMGTYVFYSMSLYYWCAACLSLLALWFYNSQRGMRLKWLFYVFYPAHLFALYLIGRFLI